MLGGQAWALKFSSQDTGTAGCVHNSVPGRQSVPGIHWSASLAIQQVPGSPQNKVEKTLRKTPALTYAPPPPQEQQNYTQGKAHKCTEFHNSELQMNSRNSSPRVGIRADQGRHTGTRTTGQEREATEADIRPELIQYSVSRCRELHQMR